MQEIEFFEQEQGHENPPHDSSHVACRTPNPPWWCYEEPNKASVDMHLFVFVIVALLVGLVVSLFKGKEE